MRPPLIPFYVLSDHDRAAEPGDTKSARSSAGADTMLALGVHRRIILRNHLIVITYVTVAQNDPRIIP